jgi:hypothetical protein
VAFRLKHLNKKIAGLVCVKQGHERERKTESLE